MRHVWSVLCGRVITEAGTNKLNLIDLPEVIVVNHALFAARVAQGKEKSAFQVNFTIVSVFRIESEDDPGMEMRLTIRGPEKSARRPTINKLTVPPQKDKKNTNLRVTGGLHEITYRGYGIYEIGVEARVPDKKRWQIVADIPLHIRAATSEELAESSPIAPEPPSEPTSAVPPGSSSPRGPSRPSRRRVSRAPRRRGSS
jgi:hypothetical protein